MAMTFPLTVSRRALIVVLGCLVLFGTALPASAAGTARTGATATAAADAGAACGSHVRPRRAGTPECATLTVPLDEFHPDSRTIGLGLLRVPAADPSRRIGSFLVNPGGPGAAGTSFAGEIAASLPTEIHDRFDIVGWDPRGVGKSSQVQCDDNLDDYYSLDFAPETDQERTALVAGVQKLVDSCEAKSGALLPYLSTATPRATWTGSVPRSATRS